MMNKKHTWHKADWIVAAIAALISFAVYAWTAAPNVTLLDSGEFLVAAQHFGVPHPTGYPVWTFLNWLFLLLPLGNAAWEVAIFSGVCASLAVGLCAALLSNILSWYLEIPLSGLRRRLPQIIALAFALMLAFSLSMWSQAVIAEVYALHALLVALLLVFCYSWVHRPSNDNLMFATLFVLTLSFSNHQLTMVLSLPIYVLILLLRTRAFLDWFFAGLLTVLMGYLGFAILSNDQAVLKTAIRFTYLVVIAFAVFVWLRRFRVRWKIIAFLPFVIAAGLLPLVYMPIASSTNPPMNWGYTREPAGFFFSINRSQYPQALSGITLKSLGRLMGTSEINQEPREAPPQRPGIPPLTKAQLWVAFFWQKLVAAFSVVGPVGYFASILFVFRFPLAKRVWIYFLHCAFFFAAFLQPIASSTKTDNADWSAQMPYHGYTNLIFAILAGVGVGLLIQKLMRLRAAYFWIAPALLVLPVFTFLGSEAGSTQRNHWFGWMFGHDMLKDLPRDSVVIGGTDPGRFVPTYMIFGESPQPAKFKRDPDFDRQDLYIITQNALGEPNYMKYLRDQYTTARPEPRNAFERWLGRATAYPKEPLVLPSPEQIKELLKNAAEEQTAKGVAPDSPQSFAFGAILKWIWENNRDRHEFFIEESFPLTWTYDYAVPHGLIYRLNKTKLDAIPPEAVDADFAYWKDYMARLLGDPAFKHDVDAQRSFSKLRQTMGNIYRHRKMDKEAEQAYLEALELWPGNLEVIAALMGYRNERGDFEASIESINRALEDDPNNLELWRFLGLMESRQEIDGKIGELVAKLKEQPKSRDTVRKLIGLYGSVAETNKAQPVIQQAMKDFPEDTDLLRAIIAFYEQTDQLGQTLDPALQLTKAENANVTNHLLLARAYFYQDKKKEFYDTARKAVELGGESVREGFASEPTFIPWRDQPEFKALIKPPQSPPPR